jgi:hypothetical protein
MLVTTGVPGLLPSVATMVVTLTVLLLITRHTGSVAVKIRQKQSLTEQHLVRLL